MRLRYRKLTSRFDAETWQVNMARRRVLTGRRRTSDTPLGIALDLARGAVPVRVEELRELEKLPHPLNGWAERPRLVESEEGEESAELLEDQLRAGTLRPEDLVEWEGQWTTIDRVHLFDEACEVAIRRRKASRARTVLATVVLVSLTAGGLLAGFAWFLRGR